jgi:prepilin-type N-terminal cleavage/methylation domain-containing protein
MKTHVKNHQAGFTLIEFIVALVVAGIVASMVYTYFGSALTQSSVPIERLKQVSNLHKVMENIVADHNRLNAINLRYKWQPSSYYGLGSVVIPTTSNGRYYFSTLAGTSGLTEPTSWPNTSGGTITEGGVTWKESGNATISVWKPNNAYSTGEIVVPIYNNGHYYKCATGGTSGSGPTRAQWLPSTVPSTPWTVTDNTVTWQEAGTILESTDVTDNLKNYLTNTPARYGTDYTVIGTSYVQFNGTAEVAAGTSGTSSEKNFFKVTIKNNDSSEVLTQIFTIR